MSTIRYISKPSDQVMQEVRDWCESNINNYDSDFDLAVDCALDAKLINSDQDYDIPQFIVDIAEDVWENN